ncbi:MAG: hypothetical protein CSA22_03985 [Deltaproteobacteria bacterium]|nr:MAG: hypothetical protein CSA22_03985 [Deltaproteobacteria bacterium]
MVHNQKHGRFARMLVGVMIVIMAAAGCVSKKACMEPTQANLESLIRQGWDARMAGEWGRIYDLATEAYKQDNNRAAMGEKSNVNIKAYTIRSIEIKADKTAEAVIDFKVKQMGILFPFSLKEYWVWEKGCKWALDLSKK